DNYPEVIHDRVDIQDIQPLTRKDYYVRGCTALLDAVGRAIHHLCRIIGNRALSVVYDQWFYT
ncbi:MAG: hypothetical protein IKY53_04130, partial [Lachnospiraceae bacterium]|nr:hypothetical protein [Lachnospiraceae bacterium]